MTASRIALLLAGLVATSAIGIAATTANGPRLVAALAAAAKAARDAAGGQGIRLSFRTPEGWVTRHPALSGGEALDNAHRARVAAAIALVPGIGGVHWVEEGIASPDSTRPSAAAAGHAERPAALHCQADVNAILKSRTVRFSEASAAIDPASARLLDEVADALRPCLGGIIAITGHTDNAGDAAANLALSRARADAVRWALVARGIPADGLRAAGLGANQPLAGLDPADPANRRIEFSVIEKAPVMPTVVDTPGPG